MELGGNFVLLICVYKQITRDLPQICIGQLLGQAKNRELADIKCLTIWTSDYRLYKRPTVKH